LRQGGTAFNVKGGKTPAYLESVMPNGLPLAAVAGKKQDVAHMATLPSYSCRISTIRTNSITETTQIWGKEFSGSMFSMMPGNSSFFVF
jgi:hypothetical protein